MGDIPVPSIVANALIVVLCGVGWLQVLLRGDKDARNLSQKGWKSLRFFTVLSNLFSCVVAVIYLAAGMTSDAGLPNWVLALKLMATTSVALTFLTVLVFLGPRLGWAKMYSGGNFWLHLVLPLIALFDCCAFVPLDVLPFNATFLSLIPVVLYGVWYIGTVLVKGAKGSATDRDGIAYDFYGFFTWGMRGLVVVCAAMLAATWITSWLIWLV